MSNAKYKFSGHQTFVFRYGWLEKGVRLIQQEPHGFLEKNVLVQLGVGKNMVESIKYWCGQIGLLRDTGQGNMELTDLAKFIFGEKDFSSGHDPYLEDEATLWLFHWALMQRSMPPESVWSTWHFAFYRWHKPEFSKQDLLQAIQMWIANQCHVTVSTLERDVDCFVRNYTGTRGKGAEESLDSPFLSLELIQGIPGSDLYRFNIGEKHNLPAEIVGYAILHYMGSRSSINVQSCLYDVGSPGQIFKINEGALMDYLVELERITQRRLQISDTAVLTTISFNAKNAGPVEYAAQLLAQYYERKA